MQGLMEHMQDVAAQNPDRQKEMAKKLEEGKLSIRDWKEQIQTVMNMSVTSLSALLLSSLGTQGAHEQDSLDDTRATPRTLGRK